MPTPKEKELLRLVVMISGNGSNLQSIINSIRRGDVAAELVGVVSDRADAFGLERARKAGITARVVSPKDFADRAAWQAELLNVVDSFSPGLVVLAGFMRILDDDFVAHFSGRMINIHPSLLPALRGLHTHRRALAEQLSHHGTSVHFVTPELDGGPVILQARVPVRLDDDETTLTARVQAAEHVIYPLVIEWFAAGRVRLYDSDVVLDGEVVAAPPVMDFN